jgi:hypothetical protein
MRERERIGRGYRSSGSSLQRIPTYTFCSHFIPAIVFSLHRRCVLFVVTSPRENANGGFPSNFPTRIKHIPQHLGRTRTRKRKQREIRVPLLDYSSANTYRFKQTNHRSRSRTYCPCHSAFHRSSEPRLSSPHLSSLHVDVPSTLQIETNHNVTQDCKLRPHSHSLTGGLATTNFAPATNTTADNANLQ